MKLKISSSEKTVFRKNLTRFAPAWALYALCYLIGFLMLREDGNRFWYISNVANLIQVSPLINIAYAFLVAQLLFGDLYNARMCNVLHALPIRREKWFATHVASGYFFAVVPCLIGCLLAMFLSIDTAVESGWLVCLYWLGGTLLQFAFFFGVAVFAAVAVGNRFAMLVVYSIVNSFAILLYFLVDTIYIPMLYGIQISEEGFLMSTPMLQMMNNQYIGVSRNMDEYGEIIRAWFYLLDGWGYLAVCAVIGVVVTGLSCLLYKKRNMESAGDFMAFRSMEPVFQVIYTVSVGGLFHTVSEVFLGLSNRWLLLIVGLVVGFFTGRMLLERQVKVFSRKNLAGCAGVMAAMALSLLVVWLDPLGLETWVPAREDIRQVGVSTGWYYNSAAPRSGEVVLEEPQEIDDALAVHEFILDHSNLEQGAVIATAELPGNEYKSMTTITINYVLKDGTTRQRYYQIFDDEEAAQLLKPYFSSMEYLFSGVSDPAEMAEKTGILNIDAGTSEVENIADEALIRSLLDAVAADCEAGLMAPNRFKDYETETWYWLEFYGEKGEYLCNVAIRSDCVNTLAWLEAHGYESGYAQRMAQEKALG